MIITVKGDLLDSDCKVIAHQANCFNTMGAGIARQIAKTYPRAYEADLKTIKGHRKKLGTFSLSIGNPEIYNLYGQYGFASQTKPATDYKALEKALKAMKNDIFHRSALAQNYGWPKVGLPSFMGCGLGGGDWSTVLGIIEKIFGNTEGITDIYLYKL